ncbi:MAG: magnesium transporter [Erysipelotrichaceae bacterium]|nr:magnesium transporter [Erysipelotrichaceae bacterium]MBQ1757085.1 magnesium transporter [Erysipelotrichaceae bacterium]
MQNMDYLQDENVKEIIELIKTIKQPRKLRRELENYHDNDISYALEGLTKEERLSLYQIIGLERTADVFSYLDDVDEYLSEINLNDAARIIEEMDSDDAVDVLEQIDDEFADKLVSLLTKKTSRDIRMIRSYDEDEIGSKMTTNYVSIPRTSTIKEAMKELVRQSEDNDNIDPIYVTDEKDQFYGEIPLKELIKARANANLENLIITEYPVIHDHEKIADALTYIREYAEQSIPVISEDNRLLGVLTAQDIIETVDEELSEDYAKLAGLTAEEDLNESLFDSMKKRLPWLGALLVLGMMVSSVVGIFEGVVAQIAIIVCFQSLVLDMAGNVGTQSLAVTIRVLMDEDVTVRQKWGLILKEVRVGFANGLLLGAASFLFIGLYVHFFKGYPWGFAFAVSFCVGVALLAAMLISSLVGTTVPMIFHKINIDPAVASGPFITTINDLVAVVSYYGLAWILLINVLKLV